MDGLSFDEFERRSFDDLQRGNFAASKSMDEFAKHAKVSGWM